MKKDSQNLIRKQPNPEMLILARQSRGYNQSELAQKIGSIKQFQLSKMENGIQSISAENLKLISTALDYPVDFFYQDEALRGPGISGLFHRKRATLSAKLLDKAHATVEIKDIQVRKLLNSVDIEHLSMPRYSIDNYTPEEIAKMTRAFWQLPSGPIRNLVEVIENAGGIIISTDFGTDKIDAISRWTKSNVPLFFVDFSKPMDRIRFSLCHELGHIIMHQIPTNNIEYEANAFAAEFLMPATDIKFDLDNLAIKDLPALKLKWKTAMSAIIFRAHELGIISDSKAQSMYIHLSKKGYRTREPEPLDPPKETPSLFSDLVKIHINDLNYSKSELGKLLLINESEVNDLLPFSRPKFKIIK